MSDQVLDAIGEVKAELIRHGMTLEQVLHQATITNGRVGQLEKWQQAVILADAADRGRLEGMATMAISKGQLRALVAAVTAIATASATIAGVVVKVL